jgi:hypothetical protein
VAGGDGLRWYRKRGEDSILRVSSSVCDPGRSRSHFTRRLRRGHFPLSRRPRAQTFVTFRQQAARARVPCARAPACRRSGGMLGRRETLEGEGPVPPYRTASYGGILLYGLHLNLT